MRTGELGWAICLAGLPWSYFLVHHLTGLTHLNLWQANTLWMQVWVLILAGVHAMNKQPLGQVPSALWWLVIWSTLLNLWMLNVQSLPGAPYAIALLPGIGHLWIVALALLLMSTFRREFLQRLVTILFWSGVSLIVYGGLQVANLDQFFHAATAEGIRDPSVSTDFLVGTIGNPTHFACQLAIWLPLAAAQPGWRKLWMLPALGLMGLAHSDTAWVTGAILLACWSWARFKVWTSVVLGTVAMGLLCLIRFDGWGWMQDSGRWQTWSLWWPMTQQHAIVGHGMGLVANLTHQLPATHALAGWKHLHNEYYQVWVELGLIGLALVGWACWQLWQRRHQAPWSPLRRVYGQMLLACGVTATLNFSWHLWQLGGWGLVGLAGWLALTEPEVAA